MAAEPATFASFSLPALPWPQNALEPVISAKTIGFHYGKHHQTYVDNLNKFTAGTEFAHMPLLDIVRATAAQSDKASIFHNAAQVWNHTFYWNCLRAKGGGAPPASLKQKIDESFASVDACKKQLSANAVEEFGSGWAWLVMDGDKLRIIKTSNADTPVTQGLTPLLTIDVWEHAYYLDYQNKRVDHVDAVINKLLKLGICLTEPGLDSVHKRLRQWIDWLIGLSRSHEGARRRGPPRSTASDDA